MSKIAAPFWRDGDDDRRRLLALLPEPLDALITRLTFHVAIPVWSKQRPVDDLLATGPSFPVAPAQGPAKAAAATRQ